MKATVNLQLDKRSVKKDGTHPAVLVVYFDGVKRRYSLKKSFTPDNWGKIITTRLRDNDLREAKADMEKTRMRAQDIIDKLGVNFTFKEFDIIFQGRLPLKSRDSQNVYLAFESYINDLKSDDRIGSATSYNTAMKAFQTFSAELTFRQVTPDFLVKFEKHLRDKGRSITTVAIYMRSLRTILNIAKYEGVITESMYPFGSRKYRKYEIPVGQNIKKALTKKQIKEIERFECDSEGFSMARDMWIFTYYMGGMNMADILRIKYEDIDGRFLTFKRTKTIRTQRRERIVELYITDEAQAIIDKWGVSDKSPDNYVFGMLADYMDEQEKFRAVHNYTRSVNQYMERVAAGLKLNMKLSLMVARHSFASISLYGNVPLPAISESMAHSSIATTENYLKGFDRASKEKFAKVLSTSKTQ